MQTILVTGGAGFIGSWLVRQLIEREDVRVVNLDKLGELFPEGGTVGVDDLVAKGAVRKGQPVKVLGQGDLAVAVQVSAQAFSGSAKDKIEAAGGTVTVV